MTMIQTKAELQQEADAVLLRLQQLNAAPDTPEYAQLSERAKGLHVRQYHATNDLLYVINQRLALIDLEAEQAAIQKRDEEQRQADLAEANRHQQEHEQALEEAAQASAEGLKADEPLPPADPVE